MKISQELCLLDTEKEDKQRQSTQNDNDNETEKTIGQIFFSGIENVMTYSDYFYCTFILKALLYHYCSLLIASSSAYLTAYFTLFIFAPASSINASIVAFTCQMSGDDNFEGVKRIFLQSLLIQVLLFFFLNIPGLFFLEYFLQMLGAGKDHIAETTFIIWLTLPIMFLRALNDIVKTLLQSQGHSFILGLCFWINVIPFPLYSWVFIGFYKLEFIGYALSLLVIESSAFLILSYLYFEKLDPKIKNNSLEKGLFHNFGWLFLQVIKGIILYCPGWFSYEFMLYFVSLKKIKYQIFIFTFLNSLTSGIGLSLVGFINNAVASISYQIGKKNIDRVVFMIYYLLGWFVVIFIIYQGIICCSLYIYSYFMGGIRETGAELRQVLLPWSLATFGYVFLWYSFGVGVTIRLTGIISIFSILGGVIGRIAWAYFFCVYLDLELYGIYTAKWVELAIRAIIIQIIFFFKDMETLKDIEGK